MRLEQREVVRLSTVWLAACLFGASFMINAATGVEAPAVANPQPGQVQTVYLEYGEVGYSFINRDLPVVTRPTPFTKEPAFDNGKVVRGTFQPGGSASNSIAFAWDWSAGKLYLDLNHNLDLTDDPAGLFGCREQKYSRYYQTFTNIHLPFKTLSGNRELLVDLNLYNYGSRPDCTAALHSIWQGKVTLQGVDWQAGVVENPSGKSNFRRQLSVAVSLDGMEKSNLLDGSYLLLRPWVERNKPFSTHSGSLDAFPFSRKLFVQNQAYQLDCINEPQGDNSRLKLQFTGQQPALGELKIKGDFIQRLILENGPYLVVLDQPGQVVKVPVGKYDWPRVCLRKGDIEAYRETSYSQSEKQITIDAKKTAELLTGGPLTNSVFVSRAGELLRFNYQLLGAGGETYKLAKQDRSNPPEFAVCKDGKKIASGKFEFG